MRHLLFAVMVVGVMTSASAQTPAPAPALAQTPVQSPASLPVSASEGTKSAKASNDALADPDNSIRCRTVRVTGSLVKKGKVCKTLAQWRQMTDSGNDLARRLVEDGTSRPGGQ